VIIIAVQLSITNGTIEREYREKKERRVKAYQAIQFYRVLPFIVTLLNIDTTSVLWTVFQIICEVNIISRSCAYQG
jgi:hypothetical protein